MVGQEGRGKIGKTREEDGLGGVVRELEEELRKSKVCPFEREIAVRTEAMEVG